ncbi:MAG TPA: DUF2062 domain-containing protein [Desulfotomaculum sp.]|nr:MAG: hypothetical protein VR67_11095 [Peptococcaceae bacterium BRH_c8a]KJS75919.1 MAG: hypothetical protein JL56_06715 [Desulfotomaculum sp. BICA1-6]HBX23427.1 DUF2062 domain-containing protein [Desulfotomaculum sp.]
MNLVGRLKNHCSRVMDIPDAPQKIARGAAIGLALDFLPLPLISIPIAYLIARLAGGNGLAAALTAALFKLAVPFFYVLNMVTGGLMLGYNDFDSVEQVAEVFSQTQVGWLVKFTLLGYPFMLGAFLNAALVLAIVYMVLLKVLLLRQKRRQTTKQV